jgi:hypothetical protein
VGFFVAAPTFWAGLKEVIGIYNPLNFINFVAELLLLSPMVFALYWRDRLRSRKSQRHPDTNQ